MCSLSFNVDHSQHSRKKKKTTDFFYYTWLRKSTTVIVGSSTARRICQETVSQGKTCTGQGCDSECSTLKPSSLALVTETKQGHAVSQGAKVPSPDIFFRSLAVVNTGWSYSFFRCLRILNQDDHGCIYYMQAVESHRCLINPRCRLKKTNHRFQIPACSARGVRAPND